MEVKKQQQQQQRNKEMRAKRVQYENRKSTLMKKGKELSILCDIDVCVVVLSPDGKLETWPENLDDVMASFRHAAESNYNRPHSNNTRKRVRRNPSKVKIDDDDGDDKRANKKMKAIFDDCHTIGNNFKGEEEGEGTGALVTGNKTEDHHHHHDLQLSLYNCSGNYYPRFPVVGERNIILFAQGIGNYENQSRCHHPPPQGCSCSRVALLSGGGSDEFLVGDPSCGSSYGGGGYSSPSGHDQFLNLHNSHLHGRSNDYHASLAPIGLVWNLAVSFWQFMLALLKN